jgi:ligand-binding SRPBCC domain-containing protein
MVTIEETTVIQAPAGLCFDLARSVEVHVLGNVHFHESAVAIGGRTSGLLELGERVTWRARHFWTWHELTSEITRFESPTYFQDVMIRGIFRSMTHDHYFRKLSNRQTEMRDVFAFAAPLPVLCRIAEVTFLGRYMRKLLQERNEVIRRVAESGEWRRYVPGDRGGGDRDPY